MMLCGKCGEQVPDGCEFCNNCGNELETSPKSIVSEQSEVKKEKVTRKMLYFGFIGIILLAVVCIGIIIGPKLFTPNLPYSTMNVNNGSQLSFYGNDIVYIGQFEASDKGAVLLKTDKNGTNTQMLLDEADVTSVFIYKKYVYYVKRTDKLISLNKLQLDGQDNETLFEIPRDGNSISKLSAYQDTIYYIQNNKLYGIDINGANEREVIPEEIRSYCIDKDSIYFAARDYIKKQKISSKSAEEVSKVNAESLCKYGSYIYFLKPSGTMCRLDLSNGSVHVLGGNNVTSYIIDKDQIYFIEKLSDDEYNAFLSDYSGTTENSSEILMAKLTLFGTGKLYAMNLDGSNRSEVEAQTLPIYSLYNTSKDKYARLSIISSGVEKLTIK